MGSVPEMWGTPESVWLDKMGMGISKKPNLSMFLGHVFEPHIIEHYHNHLIECDGPVWNLTPSPGFFKMETLPFGCTPDAWMENLIGTVGFGVEAKSTTTDKDWGPNCSTKIPDRVMVQIQHSMMVKDADSWGVSMFLYDKDRKEEIAVKVMTQGQLNEADLAEFVLDKRTYHIERDDSIIKDITQRGCAFWDEYVVRRIRPTSSAQPMELPALVNPNEVTDESLQHLVAQVAMTRIAAKVAADDAERIASVLKQQMESRNIGVLNVPHYRASYLPIIKKPTPDYPQAFLAACSLGRLSDTDQAMILSNYMKAVSQSYRLDIKESK